MLRARAELSEADFEPFLSWMAEIVGTTIPELRTQPIEFDFLAGFAAKCPRVPLGRELLWIAHRVAREAATINAFIASAREIQTECISGRYSIANNILRSLTEMHGQSYWSVQLRIALEHAIGGLEQQKRFTDSVRSQFRRGTLSYITYYTSVRNEDRITLPRFAEIIEQRITKTKYDIDIKNYILYRLLCIWPSAAAGVADILRLEQSHSVVDVYETFIAAMQIILTREEFANYRVDVRKAVSLLENIDDFRVAKLRYAMQLDGAPKGLPLRSQDQSDALLRGEVRRVVRQRSDALISTDPWQISYSAFGYAHFEARRPRTLGLTDYRLLLASIFRRDENSITNLGSLAKNTLNLSGIPVAVALYRLCDTLRNANARNVFETATLSLNSPTFGVEDSNISHFPATNARSTDRSLTAEFWNAVSSGHQTMRLSRDLGNFALACHYYNNKNYEKSIDLLKSKDFSEKSIPLCFIRAALELAAQVELGDHCAAIRLIADQASTNERCPAFLPVEQALGTLKWVDFKPLSSDLTGAIALDALWRTTEDDAVATTLRFAFSFQLRNSGLSRPSEFADHPEAFNRARLVYYLRNICVPSVMDMSLAFKTSREVFEERQAVCGALTALDPAHAADYQAEIYEISNRHAVADGLRLVDSSRIHVDTDAISRWARRRLEEDFRRYSDLVRAGIAVQGDFDEALREVFANIGTRQMYFTPDDQADTILADIFFHLRDEFLSNSDYGLDYFLSKRVRHQSFIGLVRGPLEFNNLITTRESGTGAYRSNTGWLSRLKTLTQQQLHQIDQRLAQFSEAFDAELIAVKNDKFQIYSSDRPNGLFDVPITTQMLFLVRSVAQTGIAFDDFLRMALTLFWAGLEPSLDAARRMITEDLKPRLVALFDSLRQDLRSVADCDPAFPDLSTAIGDVSVEVQRNLDASAAWFVRPEGQQAKDAFTMSQSVDIAVQSALKSHRAFSPDLKLNASGDVKLYAPDLLLLTDAIFVAIDNAKAHCDIKRNPYVSIDCCIDPQTERLVLDVRNSVNSGVRTAAVEANLTRIRQVINTEAAYSGARREGGSGFIKIAAALRHSAEGQMQFGFESDTEFRMTLSFRPTQYTIAVIRR